MDIFTQIERLEKLADVVEEHEDDFAMDWWVRDPDGGVYLNPDVITQGQVVPGVCGTKACLAGWAVSLWGAELDLEAIWAESEDQYELFPKAGAQVLGLERHVADALFDQDARHQTAREAAEVLRNMVEDIRITNGLL